MENEKKGKQEIENFPFSIFRFDYNWFVTYYQQFLFELRKIRNKWTKYSLSRWSVFSQLRFEKGKGSVIEDEKP